MRMRIKQTEPIVKEVRITLKVEGFKPVGCEGGF